MDRLQIGSTAGPSTGPTISPPVSVETLGHAVQAAGSAEDLARRLKLPLERVRAWVEGREPVPMNVFMLALDVIAAGAMRR